MRVLITGISGFVGAYLSDYLKKQDRYEVFGISASIESDKDKVRIFKCDLLNEAKVFEIVEKVRPEYIFNLAALSSPRKSFDEPGKTIGNNVNSQLNILEAVRKLNLKTRILIVSSADIYGIVPTERLPIDEVNLLNPTNPYAVSKATQDLLGLQYFNSFGMDIIRVRPFNHTGPGQSDLFVIPAFCKRIFQAKKEGKKTIKVGNLNAKRDFTDVRDIVKAYVLALEKGVTGDVYNLGSGVSVSMQEVVNKLIELTGGGIETETDKSLFLPIDNPELVCDYSKFANLTGWKPEIPFDKTLSDTLDYWKDQV